MLQYPNIDPVIFSITNTLKIRWYGALYLVGFAGCWLMCRHRTRALPAWNTAEHHNKLNDLFYYSIWGVILGGRLGYMLFYSLEAWFKDPLLIFKIYQGGMSFHGGLVGVILAIMYFCRQYQEKFWQVTDIIVPSVPFALGMGRIGNFINGELWGKVTNQPWGMVFKHVDDLPRHPSQLYAVLLEGVLLLIVLWLFARKPRKTAVVSGMFLFGYGVIRIIEEFFREPDLQYGYIAWGWLTVGQILCVPMVLFGLWLFVKHKLKRV